MTKATDELTQLRRWKSTHAFRIETLEYLLANAQIEAAAGLEARASLASERAANAMLTAEAERMRKDAERYRWLRSGHMEFGVSDGDRSKCWWKVDFTPEEADAAIDKALAGEGP